MTNISKDRLKDLLKAILDNTLSIAANNLIFEAAIAFNSAQSVTEFERNKRKELDVFIKSINSQMEYVKEQSMIYIDELIIEQNINSLIKGSDMDKDIKDWNNMSDSEKKLKYLNEIIDPIGFTYFSENEVFEYSYLEIKKRTEFILERKINSFNRHKNELTSEGRRDLDNFISILHKSQTEF